MPSRKNREHGDLNQARFRGMSTLSVIRSIWVIQMLNHIMMNVLHIPIFYVRDARSLPMLSQPGFFHCLLLGRAPHPLPG